MNGVSYYFSGKPYDLDLQHYYEAEGLEFIETNPSPTMEDIEAISNYLPGPDPRWG